MKEAIKGMNVAGVDADQFFDGGVTFQNKMKNQNRIVLVAVLLGEREPKGLKEILNLLTKMYRKYF